MKEILKRYRTLPSHYWPVVSLICYLAILLLLFLKVLFPPQGTLIFGDDIHRSYHFFRIFEQQQMQKGIFPWWNPYQFSGEPFVANPSVTFWYPPNWLFLFVDYRMAYSWIVFGHILLAMVGMNWLCKKFMSQTSAWFVGLTFGLSGYFMGRLWQGHIDILSSAPYMPIVVGCVWNALEKQSIKRMVIASLMYALQMYAGYQTISLFTAWAIGMLTLFWCVKIKSIRPIVVVLMVLVLTGGLAALQIFPAQEFFQRSIRTYSLPYSWAVAGLYTTENLKQLVSPFIFGGPDTYKGAGPNYGELSAYIGLLPLLLALVVPAVCIISRFKKHTAVRFPSKNLFIVFCMTLGIFGLWVSFASNAFLDIQYLLWKYIPFYTYLRIPSRHLLLFVFSMSILSGFGLDIIKKKSLQFIIVGCTLVDLVLFSQHFIVLKPDPGTRHNTELVAYLQKNGGLTRILPNYNVGMGTRDALDFDAAMSYGIYSATGYDPAILRNYYDFIVAANGVRNYDVQQSDVQVPYLNPRSPYVNFLNIKYFIVPTWLDGVADSGSTYKAVLEENTKDFWRLYENISVGPRFFFVPSLVIFPKKEMINDAIINQQYDLMTTALTSDNTVKATSGNDCPSGSKGEVHVDLYEANKIILTTRSPCSMILSSSEVYYPGWKATVDGAKTHIFESNLAFRALQVPVGGHTVIMEYTPSIFIFGGIVSVGTSIVCLGLLFYGKQKNYVG